MTTAAPDTQTRTSTWTFLTTPPLSGAHNMAYDLATLHEIQQGHPPVLRFFRFSQPTLSYGKHQSLEKIKPLVPSGWEVVQRPTGGGIVLHEGDLCLSLAWRAGQPPLPSRLKDHYAWIHGVILEALTPVTELRLANCQDCAPHSPFALRNCFSEPVAFDVLSGRQKIAGGALCRQKDAFLYQGSLQTRVSSHLESLLTTAFQNALG